MYENILTNTQLYICIVFYIVTLSIYTNIQYHCIAHVNIIGYGARPKLYSSIQNQSIAWEFEDELDPILLVKFYAEVSDLGTSM